MGDLEIDVDELTKALEAATKFRRLQMRAESEAIKPTRIPGMRDLGGFRIYKANNGFIIQIGLREGYPIEDAYICKEADEIGDLVTAHIVSSALED